MSSAGRRWLALSALLPAILTEWDAPGPPRGVPPRWWKFDSGCAPDASAWRFHLESAGLDPSAPARLDPELLSIRAANDAVESLPIRKATVWLVSNIPALRDTPYPLHLSPGLSFYDRAPRRTADLYPLLGMRAFHRARLKVKLDFDAGTVSVWTPGSWSGAATQFLRRLPRGFITLPPDQLSAPW
jgi:hypothetical protein